MVRHGLQDTGSTPVSPRYCSPGLPKIGKTAYYNMLFTVSHQALKDWYTDKGYLPGIMAVIHTFGRDEGFTPHTHLLVTCGGLNNSHTRWVTPVSDGFIPHEVLRKSFQAHFLAGMRELWKNQLLETVPSHYRFLFAPLVQNKIIEEVLSKVWFVWVGKRLDNAFNAVTYVARYTKRPPVAESNILDYNGNRVLFTFVEHKTEKRQCLDLTAEEFIKLLIYHIPDNNFRVVRFYVAAVVKPLSAYFFPFLFWGRCPLVQSRLAALVGTQLRLTHVLPPRRVQTRSIPLALFPPLT